MNHSYQGYDRPITKKVIFCTLKLLIKNSHKMKLEREREREREIVCVCKREGER